MQRKAKYTRRLAALTQAVELVKARAAAGDCSQELNYAAITIHEALLSIVDASKRTGSHIDAILRTGTAFIRSLAQDGDTGLPSELANQGEGAAVVDVAENSAGECMNFFAGERRASSSACDDGCASSSSIHAQTETRQRPRS